MIRWLTTAPAMASVSGVWALSVSSSSSIRASISSSRSDLASSSSSPFSNRVWYSSARRLCSAAASSEREQGHRREFSEPRLRASYPNSRRASTHFQPSERSFPASASSFSRARRSRRFASRRKDALVALGKEGRAADRASGLLVGCNASRTLPSCRWPGFRLR